MSKIFIAQSPVGNTIFAGSLIANGTQWSANRTDVTIDALVAVAKHALQFGEPIVISREDGTPEYRITVESLA